MGSECMKLADSDFADDLVLTGDSANQLQILTYSVSTEQKLLLLFIHQRRENKQYE